MSDDLTDALRAGSAGAGAASERAARRLAAAAERRGLLDVAYATVDSPLGPLLAAGTPRGLVMLAYDDATLEQRLERLSREVSPRILEAPARLDPVRRELEEYFEGRRRRFEVPVDWALTRGYAREVLRRTAEIPYGGASTYAEIAYLAGSPRGWRAAGNALGANPMPIVVPCHRVLASGGGIGGYTGGLHRKRFLLALEGVEPEDTRR
ncbi:MAG TPA: methylated-DNA--[protein]-cysteine S-methyltransferase [Miltoncostaeaceae bacterium]|jgi:methylated-DNA-[protein]-cysteine S-methyltransferase|nr:methylated-DNA--[protein]-cysteine S-methyltransferase [Miltoncostaeaceae bacterium]